MFGARTMVERLITWPENTMVEVTRTLLIMSAGSSRPSTTGATGSCSHMILCGDGVSTLLEGLTSTTSSGTTGATSLLGQPRSHLN